ncbi:hypothetical protein COB55_03325 [Candidatus Wolfebacteria bacterium]|nr:MAG: hypothetical protein COB55_03325 [Candidatus Wolfebacteria bacterium]
MRSHFLTRIRIISAAVFIIAVFLSARLYQVQIVRGESYSMKADKQYIRSNDNIFSRGSIFFTDRNGDRVSAATLKSGYVLSMNPSEIVNPRKTFESLNDVYPVDRGAFLYKAGKVDDPYEEIGKRVDEETATAIEKLELDGVQLYRERWRYYPGKSTGAQTLGFVSFNDDQLRGQYGLERYYNDVLKRESESLYVNFFAEIFGSIDKIIKKEEFSEEGDIVLSIEPSVQAFLESKLGEIESEWSSTSSGGVIINPKTGAIYALASLPTFDVNNFRSVDDVSVFSNPIVEDVYEMGSIIKAITMAIGLDTKAVTAEDTYYDSGSVELNQSTISNYDGKGRGTVSMQEVLNQSLNTGVVHVFQEVGHDIFADYMKEFGLGDETGIDLPHEVAGLVNNLNSPRDIELATASFGQGIALTPIATVRALSALANGGNMITPHLMIEIDEKFGLNKKITPRVGRSIIKPETSEEITRMLVEVVDTALLGGSVANDRYSIAAKTGTAQIASPSGGYYDDRFLHSFFGYFPAYEPEFLVLLYTIHPKGARYASQTLTHPFIDTTDFLINYYDIPPDR